MKRIFDIFLSALILLLTLPLSVIFSIIISIESKGGPFYTQSRIGKGKKEFSLYKFRTMRLGADKEGLITSSNHQSLITPFGKFLRKIKLDELPQFFNILKGDMSVVGPRPEVKKYVDLYNKEQEKVFLVKPGLTDYATLKYINEGKILSKHENPEELYIQTIMPKKLGLNLEYIKKQSIIEDIRIICLTILRLMGVIKNA